MDTLPPQNQFGHLKQQSIVRNKYIRSATTKQVKRFTSIFVRFLNHRINLSLGEILVKGVHDIFELFARYTSISIGIKHTVLKNVSKQTWFGFSAGASIQTIRD